jgi:hypothetical protein
MSAEVQAQRARKKFWVVDTESVAVTEEECLGCSNPTTWFCPKYGFTSDIGYSFFEDRSAAIRSLVETMTRRLHKAEADFEKALKLKTSLG